MASGPPSCAYFVSNSGKEEQGAVRWSLVPAGGERSEPLYLAKPKNRGKTSGWYWDAQQMHARLGTADNATNRYAVYFVRSADGTCLCVSKDTALDKCHPALLHHDGTFTRFAQSGVQSAALRISVAASGKIAFTLHASDGIAKKSASSLGKGADSRLHAELQRLTALGVPGGLPPLQDGMLLCLVRIGSLPLTDVAACAGDGQASLMWRLGLTIPHPPKNTPPTPAADPTSEIIQAVSPCFAVKTDESRDTVCCTVLPQLTPPPGSHPSTRVVLHPYSGESSKGSKKEAAVGQPFVELLHPGKASDPKKKGPVFVLGTGEVGLLPPPQAVPRGAQIGAVHDITTGGALVFSIRGLIQGAYTPGMPDSWQAQECAAALWLWPWSEAAGNIAEASEGWRGAPAAITSSGDPPVASAWVGAGVKATSGPGPSAAPHMAPASGTAAATTSSNLAQSSSTQGRSAYSSMPAFSLPDYAAGGSAAVSGTVPIPANSPLAFQGGLNSGMGPMVMGSMEYHSGMGPMGAPMSFGHMPSTDFHGRFPSFASLRRHSSGSAPDHNASSAVALPPTWQPAVRGSISGGNLPRGMRTAPPLVGGGLPTGAFKRQRSANTDSAEVLSVAETLQSLHASGGGSSVGEGSMGARQSSGQSLSGPRMTTTAAALSGIGVDLTAGNGSEVGPGAHKAARA